MIDVLLILLFILLAPIVLALGVFPAIFLLVLIHDWANKK